MLRPRSTNFRHRYADRTWREVWQVSRACSRSNTAAEALAGKRKHGEAMGPLVICQSPWRWFCYQTRNNRSSLRLASVGANSRTGLARGVIVFEKSVRGAQSSLATIQLKSCFSFGPSREERASRSGYGMIAMAPRWQRSFDDMGLICPPIPLSLASIEWLYSNT
jgi:hypothetical protein